MDAQPQLRRVRACPRWLRLMSGLLLAMSASAQRYSFKYYGHDQGLSNLAVTCLLQDRAGFLWVGTENGLHRYDGLRFTGFGVEEGLPSGRIEALHETSDGTLWVGTSAGLARRDGNQFRVVDAGASSDVWSITSDWEGTLYLGTREGLIAGLWLPATHAWRFERRPTPAGLATPAVYGLFADAGGALWFGCDSSVCRLQDGRVSIWSSSAGVPPDRWDAILADREGNLWLRSANRTLVRRRGSASFIPVAGPASSQTGNLYLDRKGRVITGTERGIATRFNNRWVLTGAEKGLPVESSRCVLEDREGSLWIGLAGAGVVRWLGRDEWENWTRLEGLAGTSVRAVYRDNRGVLWVGTEGGLQQLPLNSRPSRVWTAKDGLAGSRVRTIVGGPDGAMWIGCAPGGISRFNPATGAIRTYGADAGLASHNIWQLFWDAEGRLWVVTLGALYRSVGSGRAMRFERQIPPISDDSEIFNRIAADADGTLWVAGHRGLLRFQGGRWTRFTQRDGLRSDELYVLTLAPDGAVWVSYDGSLGLSRLTFSGGRLHAEHFDRRHQVHSNDTSFLAPAAGGRFWVGSDNGIDVYDGHGWRYLSQSDGLLWNDCVSFSFFEDRDGSVWIGTTQGLSHFQDSPAATSAPPPLAIARVQFGSSVFDPAMAVAVPFGSHSFQVRFAALTFRNEERLRFRYRLSGLHEDWVDTNERKAEYPALSPGSYTFEVLVRTQGAWSVEPARFTFRILPPWWRAWWSEGLLIILGVAAVRWFWRWRVRRVLGERNRLEKAVEERTRELLLEKAHVIDEKARVEEQNHKIERLLVQAQEGSRLKGQFLANMSHEIRTPMNGILGMSALGLEASTAEEQRECLEVVKASADSLLVLLNDILDFSKIEAGRLELDPTPFKLREFMEATARTMHAAAQRKGLDLACEVAPGLPAVLVGDASRLRQVLLNLIGNAIKFTETGGVTLHVCLQSGKGPLMLLLFSVHDTGPGIPEDKQRLIFEAFSQADGSTARKYGGTGLGLAISERIVKLMGGKIWVDSRVGEGSAFFFTAYLGQAQESELPVTPPASVPPGDAESGPFDILLAEDNLINQKLAVRLLEKRGHRVTVAADGAEAVAQYDQRTFDVILMDIQMPGMDGFEAAATIRDRERSTGKRTPIVAMTAHAEAGYAEKCRAAGMEGYVTKPVQPAQLFAAIQQFARVRESSR